MKAVEWSVVELERNVDCLETEKSFLMKSQELFAYSLLKATSDSQITAMLLLTNSALVLNIC